MTNEQNFKRGDIVVYNGEHLHISEEIIKDDVLTVYDVSQDGDKVWVKHLAVGKVDASELEMYLPFDHRTAFLTELQSLLRKYDAEICYREGDCELHIDLGNGNRFDRITYPFEYVGYDIGDEGRLNLTADNIMDFDNE